MKIKALPLVKIADIDKNFKNVSAATDVRTIPYYSPCSLIFSFTTIAAFEMLVRVPLLLVIAPNQVAKS
jgi:hypothetical protein